MFERFTHRARRVVVYAQEEARRLDHNYLGTEHMLLGLIREGEGVAARALQALNVSLLHVRGEVEDLIGRGKSAPAGHIPFTPRAKEVLELSLREAMTLDHPYVGTEHILLGMLREGEGVAAQVLVKLGADHAQVRRAVVDLLAECDTDGSEPPRPDPSELPLCAACGRPLEGHVRVGRISGPADGVSFSIAYCDRCGAAISVGPT